MSHNQLSDGDKAIIREIAREVIREHERCCPLAMKLELRAYRGLAAVVFGSGATGAVVSWALQHLFVVKPPTP